MTRAPFRGVDGVRSALRRQPRLVLYRQSKGSSSSICQVMDEVDGRAVVRFTMRIDSAEERAALEQALLRARATELGEIRRRNVRLVTGYGDRTTRDVMGDEADRAQQRWTMLDRLLAALKTAGPGEDAG